MALKPILTTGVALASAGAIVAATPAVMQAAHSDTQVAATAEAARTLQLRYDLLAALNAYEREPFSLANLITAFTEGYGGYINGEYVAEGLESPPPNPALEDKYYPLGDVDWDDEDQADAAAGSVVHNTEFAGALYYLVDTLLPEGIKLDNYFFEKDPGAAIRVAILEATGGPDTAFAAIFDTLFFLVVPNPLVFDNPLALGIDTTIPVSLTLPDVINSSLNNALDGLTGGFGTAGEINTLSVEGAAARGFQAAPEGDENEGEVKEKPSNPFAKFTSNIPSPLDITKDLNTKAKEVAASIAPKATAVTLDQEVEKVEKKVETKNVEKDEAKKDDGKKTPFKRFTAKDRLKKFTGGGSGFGPVEPADGPAPTDGGPKNETGGEGQDG